MTLQIPSYDFWWTVSAIVCVMGVCGVVLLFGALFVLLKPEQARMMRVVVSEAWAAVKARFEK